MSLSTNWTEDWETFVKDVAELFRRGLSAQDVTNQFAGKRVVWSGIVSAIDSEQHFGFNAPGVQMEMTPVDVELPGDRHDRVDYLFLNVRPQDFQFWSTAKPGARVTFSTQIGHSTGISPGIHWSELSDNKGVILFFTENSIPVDND